MGAASTYGHAHVHIRLHACTYACTPAHTHARMHVQVRWQALDPMQPEEQPTPAVLECSEALGEHHAHVHMHALDELHGLGEGQGQAQVVGPGCRPTGCRKVVGRWL